MHTKSLGFTLLELSIVIVIIGLIVAGVSAGQSLIAQAKLRGVLQEVNEMKVAIRGFQLQYGALPGDITNAFEYWGTSCAPDANRCNGNGDRLVSYGTYPVGTLGDNEGLMVAKHLTLAGLGNFIEDMSFYASGSTAQLPEQQLNSDIRYTAIYDFSSTGSCFGGQSASQAYVGNNAVGNDPNLTCLNLKRTPMVAPAQGNYRYGTMTPLEASTLDLKGDDGIVNSGIIRANEHQTATPTWHTTCFEVTGGVYNVSLDSDVCTLVFAY